jgi:hypothetical protein
MTPESDSPAQSKPSGIRSRLLEPLGVGTMLLFCLFSFFSEAHRRWMTHLPGISDNRMFLNVLLWNVEALREGRSWHDLWQMPSLYPEANMLATSEHMLGETVIFAPIYLLTGEAILSFNVMLILITILNFLSAYLVARRLLRSPISALLCAVLFTFGSYRLFQILHMQLWAHFPTPVLFLAAVRMSNRSDWRWPLCAGICLAGQFYFGMSLGYFAVVMIGLMLIALVLHSPASFLDVRFLCRLCLAGAVAGLLLLPLAGPYHEAAQRWGTWRWSSQPAMFMPQWHNFFSPVLDGPAIPISLAIASERAVYWGYTPWILLALGVIAIVQQGRQDGERLRYWPIACVMLVVALCCLSVNHFRSYRFLFHHLPGFSSLRVPGRLALLALWPCGLLGGLGLAWVGKFLLPSATRRRAILSVGVVILVFLENYHRLDVLQQYWSDARCPREEFYAKVVRNLPQGAIACVPFGEPAWDTYAVAGAMAADYLPTLNVYTSRAPFWLPALVARMQKPRSSAQAADLMGEMRLRGIRYLILDKHEVSAKVKRAWCRARTSDGQLRAQTVYEDQFNQILDLDAAPPEACLALDWASASHDCTEVVRGKANAANGFVIGSGAITLEPTLPLRPGGYEATFEYKTDRDPEGFCEITRIFLDKQELPDRQRSPIILARAPLQGRNQRLNFTVPEEKGPEPILQFRVVQNGNGRMRVHQVRIAPAG